MSDVQTYLAAQGLVDGDTGWSSVRRRVHDGSDQLVVITEDGGPPPEIGCDSGIGDAAYRDVAIQVRVRGKAWDGDSSFAKARAIHDALHGLMGAEVGSTTYLRIRARTPEPVFMGFDDQSRPEHTISFMMAAAQGAPS